MKNACLIILLVLLFNGLLAQRLLSPDGKTSVEFKISIRGSLQYQVSFGGKPVTGWSNLGLRVRGYPATAATAIASEAKKSHRHVFAWPLGENDSVVNYYNELTLSCKAGGLAYAIIARAFDGSIAFRYRLDSQSPAIQQELTTFAFPLAYTLYQYNQESVFTPVSIDTFTRPCDFPGTLTNGNYYISIGEADNINYTKAELVKGAEPHTLAVAFRKDSVVNTTTSYLTPWRTISMATSAIGLHQFSDLNLRLVEAGKSQPTAVKPGKLIRAQLTTKSGIECIDFAARHNLQYIMFDAGWYGAEFRSTSDPTQVIPEIDMPKVIAYGRQQGIGVILYVNYVGLRQKLDTLLPLFKQWGVAGIKFGFVDGLSQAGLQWLTAAVEKVNDAGFILDVHDNYKPTGLSRRYPALLTQEGIRGDENSPDAFHNTVLPFTRFIAGAADFTFCYPNATNSYAKNIKVSMAQQLALTVVYFSPLQAMFWYGRPTDYTNEGEIEFFARVPTVWNETRYLAGDIGRNISVARRHGDRWFVGNACGPQGWTTTLPLRFLSAGKKYQATVYEDDGAGSIHKRSFLVGQGDKLPVELQAAAGQAIVFEPVKQ